ncbi:MAG: hypothetical protein QM741_06320 [Rudaea sp.]|uniref:hypothetical protein n=1 Tax=Rudaea sp. TaxID=2136325 RepID=UPI0039E35DED
MRKIVVAMLLAVLSNAAFADVLYHVDLARTGARIISFEVAARGSDRFHSVPISILGAGDTVTVSIRRAEGDCIRDLRIGFADGHRVVRRDFDICRLATLRPGENLLFAARP